LAVVAAALLLLGGLAGIGMWRGWPQRLSPQDREVLLVAAELAPLHEFVLRSDGEKFSKVQFLSGRSELSYRYDHPDPAAPFHLVSRVVVAPTKAEARAVYQRVATELEAAGADDGATFEERPSFPWGDAIRYGVLVGDEGVAGRVLTCRSGTKVFCLELSGVGLDDSDWGELTAMALQSLESYQP
jgi:hypothetical protein